MLLLLLLNFRYFAIYDFLSNFIDFLDNFIFVFSVFLIFIVVCSEIQLYVTVVCSVAYNTVVCSIFIIIVCLFITFLQALVHWYAYESCFVGSSIYYQLSLGVE